jgi:hypothetical protein
MYVRAAINDLARMLFISIRFMKKNQTKENSHYRRGFNKNQKTNNTKNIVAMESAVWRTVIIADYSEIF